jgi:acetyl-CoA carboxylase biotin carboxyl carrier protein
MTDTKTMQLIGEIAENVSEKKLSEITYETGDVKIRVVGQPIQPATIQVVENNSDSKQETSSNQDKQIEERFIISPMVGIVYLKKSPSSESFVKVGDSIDINTEVCMIEAMKTFNPIKANMKGQIRSILVKDGDPVEYGTPLFSII